MVGRLSGLSQAGVPLFLNWTGSQSSPAKPSRAPGGGPSRKKKFQWTMPRTNNVKQEETKLWGRLIAGNCDFRRMELSQLGSYARVFAIMPAM
jgi:hypothetical protein